MNNHNKKHFHTKLKTKCQKDPLYAKVRGEPLYTALHLHMQSGFSLDKHKQNCGNACTALIIVAL